MIIICINKFFIYFVNFKIYQSKIFFFFSFDCNLYISMSVNTSNIDNSGVLLLFFINGLELMMIKAKNLLI